MMALITPGSLYYILKVSLLSRFIVFLIQFVSNVTLPDHHADAYRNKYYKSISNGTSSLDLVPSTYLKLYESIEGFTKWDAQYFLEISNDGYTSEQHFAFLPLFSIIINLARKFIFEHSPISLTNLLPEIKLVHDDSTIPVVYLENYITSAGIAFILNNLIFFPLACISLFGLTRLVRDADEKNAKNTVWWFCFNPASIFFSACYTESLFAAATFTAMFLIEYKAHNYQLSVKVNRFDGDEISRVEVRHPKTRIEPLTQFDRLVTICLPSLAFLTIGCATRSNGVVSIGFIYYQFLLKYITYSKTNRTNWSILVYASVILEVLQDVLVLIIGSVIAASGYISFQIYTYTKLCLDKDSSSENDTFHNKPDMCYSLIPHPYQHIQRKHWNVGPFRYFEFKQMPNFLLAVPIAILVLFNSCEKINSGLRHTTRASRKELAYYIQAASMTFFCILSINVQVTTRLLASACPVVYWNCVDHSEKSRSKRTILLFYFVSYLIIGTILHTNFYPWT